MTQPLDSPAAGLIGDIVSSRGAEDRAALQSRLTTVLDQLERRLDRTLRITLGDEFQGSYESVSDAVDASLLLHLYAAGDFEIRVGIGWGDLNVAGTDDSPFGQDGPMWWRARDAIEDVENLSDGRRTMVKSDTDVDPLLNSYLATRDALLSGLDASNASIVIDLIDGRTQRDIAGRLGIHESSVSRRIRNHRLGTLADLYGTPLPALGDA